jgi:hypothetical protein
MWTLLKWRANGEIEPPTAAEIIAAEKAEHEPKTARLIEARLAKEATDLVHAPGEQGKVS